MMWNVMSQHGAVKLSSPTPDGAAKLYALTHGLRGEPSLCPSGAPAVSSYVVDGISIFVTRDGVDMDGVNAAAVDLHSRLNLPDTDDESHEVIVSVLERLAGYPEYGNRN